MREVETGLAAGWLRRPPAEGPLVAQLPDAAELGMAVANWQWWFRDAVSLCLGASAGPTVFIQNDRKYEGRWISKAAIVISVAAAERCDLLWHKIALRRAPGQTDIHRPTYRHVLALGPGRPGKARPDVLPHTPGLWDHGAPANVALMVAEYLAETGATRVLNPFCGHGTILAAAESIGLDAYGVEVDADRAAIAATVTAEQVEELAKEKR